jgi:hypothetical protein
VAQKQGLSASRHGCFQHDTWTAGIFWVLQTGKFFLKCDTSGRCYSLRINKSDLHCFVTLKAGIGGSCEFCSDDEMRESTFGSQCFWFSFVLFDKEFLVFYL